MSVGRKQAGFDMGDESHDENGVATAGTVLWLEDKYRSQMRQIFATKIDLPLLTLKSQIDEQITLRPDFQRRDRWNDEKRSRFIESLIMNVPVPPVFLGEEQYGKYVVLDGRQRLTALYNFLNNELRLQGLHVWSELNGLTYSAIRERGFSATIERRFLPAVLLTRESSPQVKYEVFDRLNTGGVIAEPMEVRNAIFPGPFNDLLHKLSSDPIFRRLWNIPDGGDPVALEKNSLYREMADLELVLRFFALRPATLQGLRFKDRLSEFMQERNDSYRADSGLRERDSAEFLSAIQNADELFGDAAFKRPAADGSVGDRRSAPYADAIMQSLSTVPLTDVRAHSAQLRAALRALPGDPAFAAAISAGTNGESAIRIRITMARDAVTDVLAGRPVAPARRRTKRK